MYALVEILGKQYKAVEGETRFSLSLTGTMPDSALLMLQAHQSRQLSAVKSKVTRSRFTSSTEERVTEEPRDTDSSIP